MKIYMHEEYIESYLSITCKKFFSVDGNGF